MESHENALSKRVVKVLNALGTMSSTAGHFEASQVAALKARLHAEVDSACGRLRVEKAVEFSLADLDEDVDNGDDDD